MRWELLFYCPRFEHFKLDLSLLESVHSLLFLEESKPVITRP